MQVDRVSNLYNKCKCDTDHSYEVNVYRLLGVPYRLKNTVLKYRKHKNKK